MVNFYHKPILKDKSMKMVKIYPHLGEYTDGREVLYIVCKAGSEDVAGTYSANSYKRKSIGETKTRKK